MSATDTGRYEVKFVDDLPKINRKVESGVWVKRLEPLRERPGDWAQIFGPTNSPHAQVNNLRSGNAAGIDPDEWQFAGRNIPTGREVEQVVYARDEDGKLLRDEDGNKVPELDEQGDPVTVTVDEREGYVFARFLTEEQRAERDAKREAGEDPDAEEDDEV